MIRVFIPLFTSLLMSLGGFAQQGVFEVRLRAKSTDCAAQKLFVSVEIKARDDRSAFQMGNANLRFQYDPLAVKSPVLFKQENFSGTGENANQNYSDQSLNGSVERTGRGIVSLNIIYTGGGQGATRVGANWVPVATLQFDIVNRQSKSQTTLEWNDDKAFPVSGLSEVVVKSTSGSFDYDAFSVKAGGVFENAVLGPFATICSGSDSPSGDVTIPEGFSPNGDGINDVFVIQNLGGLKAELVIFNRNGVVLYENKDYQNDWDGQTIQRGKLPSGTYFYNVLLSDGQKFSRSLTISY